MRISKDTSDTQLDEEVKMKNRDYHEGDWALQTSETQQKYCVTLNTHQFTRIAASGKRTETV